MSKEMIVRLNEDRVKIKGCEYVQELVRCRDCTAWSLMRDDVGKCDAYLISTRADDFCSVAEPKEEE